MNAQNTNVHIRLWQYEFWLLAISEFLLSMSVYMLLPTMPLWLDNDQNLSALETGLVMGAFGAGLFVLGAFVSFLVQHYRRNIVCIVAIAAVAALLALLYYIDGLRCQFVDFPVLLLLRFAMGAAFGLSQMVLCSTLIIDTCESFQRTEANFATGWFGRVSLALGPLAGLLLLRYTDQSMVFLAAAGCAVASLVLVLLVKFPFRIPDDDVSVFCLDRFFLPHGTVLFLNLLLVTIAFGMLLSLQLPIRFYAMMMCGFLGALVCWRFVFRDAELKSEVVTGLILLGAALIMLLTRSALPIVSYAAPMFVGLGMGLIGSRFLLFFIKLSRHCQRGTSQSTFMLGWESGIALGLGLGLGCFSGAPQLLMFTSLFLVVSALAAYQFSHDWFMKNKNR
ncbi:MAG: MFS transporter [Prevotella sp.]|nr:MFS transporter [Prevotella sp.]MBQ6202261.1 MFS transporter [Prevotella sp.]